MSAPQHSISSFFHISHRIPALTCVAVALGALSLPAHAQVSQTESQWVPGRLLVQPRAGLPEAEFEKILKQHGGKQVGKIEGINVRVIQLPPQASEKAVEALLKKNKHLKFAERDMLIKPDATANDPYYGSAWHLSKIGVSSAWDVSTGRGATIAILDTGVDSNHPDLAGKMVSGWNCYDNSSNTADVHGHGTAVAGTAAAATNNALGVAAPAADALIMPMRITDTNGYGYWSAAAQCITWAADRGANVANISFGGVSGSSTVQSAAQYLKNKGGLTVVAAGNNSGEELIAANSTMISVSATDSNDVKASWSSYGKYVDIAAPGTNIWTTTRGGSYQKWQGTSFASPVVAGVVGLMKASNPALGAADIEKVLFSTAVDLGTTGWDAYYGNGRVDAAAAVKAVQTAQASDTTAPSVGISNPAAGSTVSGLVAVDVSAIDNVGVSRVELTVNGKSVGSDTTAPFGFSWDSTTVADGSATVTAYAYDAAGNYASKTVSVTVANSAEKTLSADTVAPVATISNPTGGSKVSGTVSVKGAGSDDAGVTLMRLYVNGKLVSSVNGASLSYSWNTRKVATGSHTLKLEATDAAGNVGSQSIQVTR
ncbi:Thermitase [Thauera sp. GDN1]|uniref:S8 family serine peptidase n=1 Tax=Thauera sp. GDN1 TaxID=2944810 RepID=UPI002478F0C8|nr:S8 family serine peptidase [Thauera sp. GDN1]WEN43589.1 Thermitase [Thauera sp. GDN1]